MTAFERGLSRRSLLKVLGLAGGGLAAGGWPGAGEVMAQAASIGTYSAAWFRHHFSSERV
jgi:hypothetical protein